MSILRRILPIVAMSSLPLSGCAAVAAPPTPGSAPHPLATAYSAQPAAGICAEPAGPEVVLVLEPGIPDPRCSIVSASQVLRVVNRTGSVVSVTLGRETISLASEAEAVLETPFGQALRPGVHLVLVEPCCGGELWLKE